MIPGYRQLAYRFIHLDLTGDGEALQPLAVRVVHIRIVTSACKGNILAAKLSLAVVTEGPDRTVFADHSGHVAAGIDPPGIVNGCPHGNDLAGTVGPGVPGGIQDPGRIGGGPAVTQLAVGVVTPDIDTAVTVHGHNVGLARGNGYDILEIGRCIDVIPGIFIDSGGVILVILLKLVGIHQSLTGKDLYRRQDAVGAIPAVTVQLGRLPCPGGGRVKGVVQGLVLIGLIHA